MPYTVNPITGDLVYTPGNAGSGSSKGSGSGPLKVAGGGTGLTTVAENALLLGNGTDDFKAYQLDCPDNSIALTVDDANAEYKIQANFPSSIATYAYYSNTSSQRVHNGTFLICDKDATSNQTIVMADYNPVIHNPVITIIGDGTHNWRVSTPYSNTKFIVGSNQTTPGSSGYIASMTPTDCIQLVYIDTTTWAVQVLEGNVLIS